MAGDQVLWPENDSSCHDVRKRSSRCYHQMSISGTDVTGMPVQSVNKTAHSGLETQRKRHQK